MKRPKKTVQSFSQVVIDFVSLGECTPLQVLAAVGWHITATRAAHEARRRALRCALPSKVKLELGKRSIVNNALGRLARDGKITRLGLALYGPVKPKLYQPDAVS